MAEPVTNPETFQKVVQALSRYSEGGLYCDIFRTGCYMGIRASDLLALEFDDFKDDLLKVKEKKTGKINSIHCPPAVLEIVQRRKKAFPNDKYLFQGKSNRGQNKPLSIRAFNMALEYAAKKTGLTGKLSSHSMRKTLGYTVYKKTNDLALVCKMLNHSSIKETLCYIGMEAEKEAKARAELTF